MTRAEINQLRIGDVIQWGDSRPRIVREVSRWGGRVRSVGCVIQRRSWTNRAHTHLDAYQLQGYRRLPFRVKLGSLMDWKIHRSMREHHERVLTYDDVAGMT